MTGTDSLTTVLSTLDGVRSKSSGGYTARCPGHEDRTNSLSIDVSADGVILLKCFAGCSQQQVIERLCAMAGMTPRDLFAPQVDSDLRNGHSPHTGITGTGPRPPAPWPGLTLEQYAATKKLDPAHLRRCGVTDARYAGKPALRISYRDSAGGERAVRFRVAMDKGKGYDRFKWETGASVSLYGLDQLPLARGRGYVVLPEGESDTQTLWHHDEPALGIPGVDNWKELRDAPQLADIPTIYVPIEPDHGGRKLREKLMGSALADRLHVVDLGPYGVKDVSALHCADPSRFAERWEAAKAAAIPLLASPGAGGPSAKAPASRIITADALSTKSFPEPRWAVPGVVPDGATVLVGAPKKGKSWLLLGLGIAIAAGSRALGKVAVDGGDVLLLCLEDNQRRLQERLWRVLDGERAPNRLHLVTEWPRLGEGADTALDAWLTEHPATRLVGIDVLARLRPPSNTNGNLYQLDYWTLAGLKAVADTHGVALVVVHHSRKASADDPLDTISGTAGLAGAADTALILTREKGRADGNLYVRGRDVPEADYALGFDPVTCQWHLLGDAAEFRLTTGRAEVLALLRSRGPLSPKDIAEALGAERGNMRVLLHRMKNAGEVLVSDGIYRVPPSSPVTGVTPQENGATVRNSPVTPPVTPPEDVTPPCNRENPITMRKSDPVTHVTPGRDGVSLSGHLPPHQARPNTVRVSIA